MSATTTTPVSYLTVDEVSAELFGGSVSPSKVIKLAKNDGLPMHLVGRRYLFIADEVDTWIRARDLKGNTAAAPVAPTGVAPGDSDWLAATLAKFSPDDLRRVAQVLRSVADDHARELSSGGAA